MCGIAGIIDLNPVPACHAAAVRAMLPALAHRGPDDEGLFSVPGTTLGHRRLSIIDPAGGRQPFVSDDRQCALVFNGAIYNHRELRAELAQHGHRFRTRSDTEVLLRAWEQWGESCVHRLRGMFAFAVSDQRRRMAFLARDPFGIKPLVYRFSGGCLQFASEIRPLAALAGAAREIDLAALDRYLHLGYIPAPRTIWSGICKLPPAHTLCVPLDRPATPAPVRYWSMDYRPDPVSDLEEWCARLEEVLADSVRAHLVADVPYGAFLSGGLDSTLVTALMARHAPHSFVAFTAGFDDPQFDESRWAQRAATRIGCELQVQRVNADPLPVLADLIRHFGEPFADWSAVPVHALSAAARRQVPMVLSGDGGDELFAGYRHHARWMSENGLPYHRVMLRCMDAEWREQLWRPELQVRVDDDPERIECMRDTPAVTCPSRFALARNVDLNCYLPGSVLAKVDIASMMHGLEVRTPLLDVEVARCVAAIPERLLIAPAADRHWTGKRIIRTLLGGRRFPAFGAEFLHRPKQGFVPPIAGHLRSAPLRPAVRERLLGSPGLLEYLRPVGILGRIRAMEAGGGAEPVWALLCLAEWLRQDARTAA